MDNPGNSTPLAFTNVRHMGNFVEVRIIFPDAYGRIT
jgi:hypothetical protein